MKNIHRVVCFDLDGTLLDSQERIRPGDLEVLQGMNGTLFIPASGRSLSTVKEIFNANGLFNEMPIAFPLVMQNGAVTYMPGEIPHMCKVFEPNLQTQIVAIVEQFPHIPFYMVTNNQHYVMRPNLHAEFYASMFRIQLDEFPRDNPDVHLTKIMAVTPDLDALDMYVHALELIQAEKTYSLPTIYEIAPPGATKGAGLISILHALDVPGEVEILVAGDGENDLSMFTVATKSFAPGHASEIVRQAADVIFNPQSAGILDLIMNH